MARKTSVRWAFNVTNWVPTESEISLAATCIQSEEKLRIGRFVFQNDAKSSLIGRLMMRKFVHMATNMPYESIRFDRDSHGKPILTGSGFSNPQFNISHQGDFVVLAGESESKVGIDVMKIEPPVNKNIPEFFRIMSRQFSKQEWTTIKSYPSETEQVASFYRHWCLKESYVKNIGVGITVNLADLCFDVQSCDLKIGEITSNTVLYVKGVKQDGWTFEETLLNQNHAASVALELKNINDWQPTAYVHLSFEELMKEAKTFNSVDKTFTDNFLKKELKKF